METSVASTGLPLPANNKRRVGQCPRRRVLFISGWTPGPLTQLEEFLLARGHTVEWVPVPMPPMGCSWMMNPFLPVIALIAGGAVMALRTLLAARVGIPLAAEGVGVVETIAIALILGRLAVAGLVRTAITQGVARARARMATCDDVAFVVGFSWGGAVVHWLLAAHPDLQDDAAAAAVHPAPPPALILAAPVLTLSSICRLKEPPALPAPRRGGSGVTAVLATDDGFCAHPATARVYEAAGCEVIVTADDHVLQRQSSLRAIVTVALRWMDDDGDVNRHYQQQRRRRGDGGDGDSGGGGGGGGLAPAL